MISRTPKPGRRRNALVVNGNARQSKSSGLMCAGVTNDAACFQTNGPSRAQRPWLTPAPLAIPCANPSLPLHSAFSRMDRVQKCGRAGRIFP